MTSRVANLTGGRLLARNTVWNLLGLLAPLIVGIVAIPAIVRGLGVPRFGVLSLAWIVIGYFSLFDLGIGRALTKLISDKLAANDDLSVPPLVWTSLLLMLVLGCVSGVVMAATTSWLVHAVLKVPVALQPETQKSFWLLASSLPVVTVTSGLRGVLEALQRFRLLNLIRIPMSVFSFIGPLLVLPFSHSLFPVVLVLVAGRLIGCVIHIAACFRAMPALRQHFTVRRSIILPVVKFGGWMTVSNVIGPIMLYMDRFLVGALLSVNMVAYYTAPFDMVTRLWVIPGALVAVVFPAFAVTHQQDPDRTVLLLNRGTKYVFLAVFPLILVISTLAPEGLRLWLGPAFSQNGASVLRWLSAGVLVNSLVQVAFALIQGIGRPDITARLHLVELPVYLLAVWLLTTRFGIQGTAAAWFGRNALDAVAVVVLACRFIARSSRFYLPLAAAGASGLLLVFLGTLPQTLVAKAGFLALTLVSFGLLGWFVILAEGERALLSSPKKATAIKVQGT